MRLYILTVLTMGWEFFLVLFFTLFFLIDWDVVGTNILLYTKEHSAVSATTQQIQMHFYYFD